MLEWFKRLVSKTSKVQKLSWVRILLVVQLERATCKEQGLPAKQIVHLVWIGVGIQPLRKDCINTAYVAGREPN